MDSFLGLSMHLEVVIDVLLHKQIDGHILYGWNGLLEDHMVAEGQNAIVTLQARTLSDEVFHCALFQVAYILG